ncbi:hypothetical protein [Psychroflexus aestuariivivens]|uniref:hypothetical protein n=1 Tax=Psychroflexus aestuariivivens TaxID=1795040 RepID=UPI000FD7E530|nr:hypothetical protein [Psychroflexus aestuariivivens]
MNTEIKYSYYLLICILLISCAKSKKHEKQFESDYPYTMITRLNDSVVVGEYSKFHLLLGNPTFYDKNSSVQVALDMSKGDSIHLLNDLSNIDSIPFRIFQNLELDTLNKNFGKSDTIKRRRQVLFFKKFAKPGYKKIRGLSVEYYGDYNPLTLQFDGKDGDTIKQYFEIYVKVNDTI